MKIAIFSDIFYPEISGISDSLITLINEFQKIDYEIYLFAPTYKFDDYDLANKTNLHELFFGKKTKIIRLPSIKLFNSPTKQGRLVIPLGSSIRHIKKFMPDVIWSQSPFGVGIEAFLCSKMFNIPMIGTNHTIAEEFIHYFGIKAVSFKNLILRYYNWYYRQCQIITSPSNNLLSRMSNSADVCSHIKIPNPINPNFKIVKDEQKTYLKRKYELSDFCLIYSGRLAAEKNIIDIILAVSTLQNVIPDLNLILLGRGQAENILKKQVKNLNLNKTVKFFGIADEIQQIEINQACDIFVIMSTSETQSLSLMKAMSCGIPVIGANSQALPEYINSKNGILVNPHDHKMLAEKIHYLYMNPEIRVQMGINGNTFVRSFTPQVISRDWQKLFESVVK